MALGVWRLHLATVCGELISLAADLSAQSGYGDVIAVTGHAVPGFIAYATRNTSALFREEPSNSPVKRVIRLVPSSGLALGVNGSV